MSTVDKPGSDLKKLFRCQGRRCTTCSSESCQEFVVRFVRRVNAQWVREQLSLRTTSAERAVRIALARLRVKPQELFVAIDREGQVCDRDSARVQVVDSTPVSSTYEVLRHPLTIRRVSSAKAS